jgi:pyruvate ferredoxin oxidoreductase beta subunit
MSETTQKLFRTIKDLPKDEYLVGGHRACQGCGEALALRLILKAIGPDVVVASATGCMEVVTSPYPYTSWEVPWIHVAFENTAAVASGIQAAFKVLMRKGVLPQKKIHVLAFAGDGGTADIGLQALSGALERGHDFVYVCTDNEAYMNTGIQRSGATPYGAWTTTSPAGKIRPVGQITWKKDMPAIAAAHNIPYVATATVAYPIDLVNKARKAVDVDGPAYLHVYSPCPTGWRFATEKAIQISRVGVQTGVYPIYEIENGVFKLTVKPSRRKPVVDYLKMQGRFRHLTDKDIEFIQKRIDEQATKMGLPPIN